jgi:DNA-binding response OmpR family regulator
MNKILIIEDDKTLRDELSLLLTNAGYSAEKATDFSAVDTLIKNTDADLLLLDINLPNSNGEALLQEFRKVKDTPVIMLTSRTGELDEVLSMSYGADDYITKPYNPTILLLRISAVLKRARKTGQERVYKNIRINSLKGILASDTNEILLTKNEMLIFQTLLDHPEEIVSRDDLMTVLWDNNEFINDNTLSVNISRLRSKLADLGIPEAIETRKKQGYVLR